MIISLQGFLIHSRKYRETSSIVNFFTSEKGVQSLLFKGKYTNKDRYRFSIFNEYIFTFDDKYNLPYLSKCEHVHDYGFDKKYYLLGLYINELLYKTSREGFDFDKIYKRYKDFLVILSNSSDSSNKLALFFEKNLLQDLGYELTVCDKDISHNANYIYSFGEGFKKSISTMDNMSISGQDLELFLDNTMSDEKEVIKFRSIIKNIFSNIYPDLRLTGDRLF